jgi:septal ring factor EnvC (AmiA/AmiB activator)
MDRSIEQLETALREAQLALDRINRAPSVEPAALRAAERVRQSARDALARAIAARKAAEKKTPPAGIGAQNAHPLTPGPLTWLSA